jgi:outer membrane protein
MKSLYLLFTAATIFMMSSQITAQSQQQKLSLTIEKALAVGLENSKSLHSSFMKVQGVEAKSSETNAQRLPSIKLGGSYTRLSDVPAFQAVIPANAFGPNFPPQQVSFPLSQTILNNYNLRATLQQPLFTGFRLQSSSAIADYTTQATNEDYHKDRAELIYNIKNAYWSLYKANEFKKVIDENVEQMKAHLNDVENFFKQGVVTKNEVLKVEVQLSNAQLLQLDAKNNVQLAMIGLNNIVGLPLNTEIDIASTAQLPQQVTNDLLSLTQKALDMRPELRGMDYRVKASEAGVTLARSGWFPQIYLSGNYYYARPNQRIVPSLDQFKDTWDVNLSFSLDVWNWGTTIHQTHQAQALLEQTQDALSQLRDGITLEVTQNYLNFNQSKERIDVAKKGVTQAEENYRITDEKFKSGLALNSDLLDAEVALLQARWNYIQALVDHELADAKLQKAIGSESSQ